MRLHFGSSLPHDGQVTLHTPFGCEELSVSPSGPPCSFPVLKHQDHLLYTGYTQLHEFKIDYWNQNRPILTV